MLLDAGLPKRFWAEAVNTAAYIQNRLPSAAVDATPFEIWFGRKPQLKGMKIFGCAAYAWIPPQKRKKFEVKAEKLTFVGYSSEHKAYRLLDARTGRIVVSRDVRFVELDEGSPTAGEASCKQYAESKQDLEEEITVRLTNASKAEVPLGNQLEEDLRDQDVNSEEEYFGFDDAEVFPGFEEAPVQEESEEGSDTLRRSSRPNIGVPPERFSETIGLAAVVPCEPRSYAEAMVSPERDMWVAAMAEEMSSLQENDTWKLTKLPVGRRAIGSKWVFKRKESTTGNAVRFKARLVAQGFFQKFGSEYDEVFAPVVRQTTFRTVLTLASSRNMLTRHVDIKTAYLYGELQEEIFMKQPQGYESEDPTMVCLLKRSLYGLKQAARVWNQKIDAVLKGFGFKLYVDDFIVVCNTEQEYQSLVKVLEQNFKITELGDLSCFLGIQERKQAGVYVLNQKPYILKTLVRFGMEKANTSRVPMANGYLQQQQEESEALVEKDQYQSLVGALLYIAINSRPDIAIATSVLGRRVSNPTKADWIEAKKVLRYLKGTINHELQLGSDGAHKLECFVDADWAGEVTDRKSNTGFLFKFGGGLIEWCCRKQTSVALSSTEAEYIALADCLQELQWLRKLMADLGVSLKYPVAVHEDNQSCIALSATDRTSRRSKHIDTKYCFVKDLVASGIVSIKYCPTERMEADILTKPLAVVKLRELREAIGLKSTEVEEEC